MGHIYKPAIFKNTKTIIMAAFQTTDSEGKHKQASFFVVDRCRNASQKKKLLKRKKHFQQLSRLALHSSVVELRLAFTALGRSKLE